MRTNKKQITTTFILCSLLLIGVVYAILQANLQINGIAKISSNTWDIHFDNIQINTNSVAIGENDSPATIDPENNCKVDFEVTLSLPGDFYEFTVDVVNSGTIDGMIGELNKTLIVNNVVVEEVPDYLIYSVTYEDGDEVLEKQMISKNSSETINVRLEFKKDIEELPDATTITTSLTPEFVQADSTADTSRNSLYNVLKKAVNLNLASEYTGNHKDSFTEQATKKIYYWSEDDISILDKWNVIFGGFCWQMYRTTDTGGIKLLYNGVPSSGKCNATGANTAIGTSKYDNINIYDNYILFDVGYRKYDRENFSFGFWKDNYSYYEDIIYGSDFIYDGNYILVDTTDTQYYTEYPYTCLNSSGECSELYYYFDDGYYFNFFYGVGIEDAINEIENVSSTGSDSLIKTVLETWYYQNLRSYSNMLEDTIFCGDRSHNEELDSIVTVYFKNYDKYNNTDLSCTKISDQFSVNNNSAKISYPIGLMSLSEYNLANASDVFYTERDYWLMTPHSIEDGYIKNYAVFGYQAQDANLAEELDVRPVVSLKVGTSYVRGDGSRNNPYVVE